MKNYLLFPIIGLFIAFTGCEFGIKNEVKTEKLESWNETPIKEEIVSFVTSVIDMNSDQYVEIDNRIAVFDNDGTLWNEKPLYIQVAYEIDYITGLVNDNPELNDHKLYHGITTGNLSVMYEYTTLELINELFSTHDGQDEKLYKQLAYEFLSKNNHPKYNRVYKSLTYLPMVELVHYLQQNDFKVYIVTGGELSFVRTISKEIYNIPVENVIGSNVAYKYNSDTTAGPIFRTGKIASANDKHIKPVNIELHIGKKPIFAAGNSDGDYEMMEYTLSGNGPSMAILVNHDDEVREYKYMHGTEKAYNNANEKGWGIISMKNDFKVIFEEEK